MAVGSTVDTPAVRATVATRASLRRGVLEAGPLALAGLLANGGSLLVTVVLARLLSSHGYGALNQLIGIFFVVSTPGTALLVAVVRRAAAWRASDDGDMKIWARGLHRGVGWGLVGCVAALAAGGSALGSFLGRHDPAGLDAIALAGAVWVALCVDRGLLQARREYRTLSVNLLTEGALRTVLMVVAAVAGLGVTGVAVGVLVAELGTALQARAMALRPWRGAGMDAAGMVPDARRHAWAMGPRRIATTLTTVLAHPWIALRHSTEQPQGQGLGHRLGHRRRLSAPAHFSRRDVAAAVVSLAAIALLQNIDVIVMGKEGPRQAGAYAVVSVSSKVLVFLALVVGGYLLPEAAHAWRDGTHALRQLTVSLALVGVPGVVIAVVAAVVPRWFITVFFSARYVGATGAFLPLAGAMVCLSGVVLLTMYLLAVGDRRIAGLLVLAAVVATAALAVAHGDPRTTAVADLAVQGSLAALAVAELAVVHRTRRTGTARVRSGAAGPVGASGGS